LRWLAPLLISRRRSLLRAPQWCHQAFTPRSRRQGTPALVTDRHDLILGDPLLGHRSESALRKASEVGVGATGRPLLKAERTTHQPSPTLDVFLHVRAYLDRPGASKAKGFPRHPASSRTSARAVRSHSRSSASRATGRAGWVFEPTQSSRNRSAASPSAGGNASTPTSRFCTSPAG
jgi:hypothetical protein